VKSTGVARKVDQLGRVVLPSELRRALGIREGDLVDFSVEDRRIVIEKVEQRCTFCGGAAELREFRDRLVCAGCASELASDA
jgi:transcriptional pleiotropic regulator of transition state genes